MLRYVAVAGVMVLAARCSGGERQPLKAVRPWSPVTAPAAKGVQVPSTPGLPGRPFGQGFAADGSGFVLLAQCVEDAP